jgi:uncharacterized protein
MPDLEPLFGDRNEPKEIKDLRKILSVLTPGYAIAFGASCCERVLPCYQACSLIERHGDFLILRRHLDSIWDLSLGEGATPANALLDELKRAFPRALPRVSRPDVCYDWEFDSSLACQADYAVGAVMALEQGLVEGREADYAAVAGDAALLSVREFLVNMNDPSPPWGMEVMRAAIDDLDEFMPPWGWEEDREAAMFLEVIEGLPLMVQEREKQASDLELLKAREGLDRTFLDEFRRNAGQGGIQPFRRGFFARPGSKYAP